MRSLSLDGGLDIFRFVRQHVDSRESLRESRWTFDSDLDKLSLSRRELDDFCTVCKSCEDLSFTPRKLARSVSCGFIENLSSGNLLSVLRTVDDDVGIVTPAVAMLRRSVKSFRSISYDERGDVVLTADIPSCDSCDDLRHIRRARLHRSSSPEIIEKTDFSLPSVLKNNVNSASQVDISRVSPAVSMLRRNFQSFRSISVDERSRVALNTDASGDTSENLENILVRRKGTIDTTTAILADSVDSLPSNRLKFLKKWNSSSQPDISRISPSVAMLRRNLLIRNAAYDYRSTRLITQKVVSINEDANLIVDPGGTSKVEIECECALCTIDARPRTSLLPSAVREVIRRIVRSRGYHRDVSFYERPVVSKNDNEILVCLLQVLKFLLGLWCRHFDHK